MISDWFKQMPIYVTRKTAGGDTGQLYLAFWIVLPAFLLVVFNIIGWGAYGLYELGDKVI